MSKSMDLLLKQQKRNQEEMQRVADKGKVIAKKIKAQAEKDRTHRLCERGGYLEKLLVEPTLLSDEEVFRFLDYAFNTPFVKEALAKLLETKRKEAVEKEAAEAGDAEAAQETKAVMPTE